MVLIDQPEHAAHASHTHSCCETAAPQVVGACVCVCLCVCVCAGYPMRTSRLKYSEVYLAATTVDKTRMAMACALNAQPSDAARPSTNAALRQFCMMWSVGFNHTTWNMQPRHAADGMQRATRKRQCATQSVQRATCNIQHATCGMQRAPCDPPHAPIHRERRDGSANAAGVAAACSARPVAPARRGAAGRGWESGRRTTAHTSGPRRAPCLAGAL